MITVDTLEEFVSIVDRHNALPYNAQKAEKVTNADVVQWITDTLLPEARAELSKTRYAGELRIVITENPGVRRPWEWAVQEWEPTDGKPGWGKWLTCYTPYDAFRRYSGECSTERKAELEARISAAHVTAARSADRRRETTRRVIDL